MNNVNLTVAKYHNLTHLLQTIPENIRSPHHYHIHGIGVEIVSDSEEVLSQFNQLFEYFAVTDAGFSSSLRLRITTLSPDLNAELTSCERCKPYGRSGSLTCHACHNSFVYFYKKSGALFLDMADNFGIGYINSACSAQEIQALCRELFIPALSVLMRSHSLFPIHASAVATRDARGILIPGLSGRGKTTLLLHLIKAGLQYMADDAVFLQENASGIEMLSCPTEVRVTAAMAQVFPDISACIAEGLPGHGGKYSLDILRCYHLTPIRVATPALLLLPEITTAEKTTIAPMTRMESALEWFPQNILMGAAAMSKRNFKILAGVARDMPCFRIRLGKDTSSVGHQVIDLIRET